MPRLALGRRAVLRGIAGGTAVTIGLPLLEAMLDGNGEAYAGGEPLPLRFISYYWADGINIARFEPAQTGAAWELSEHLLPLEPVKDSINLCTGLRTVCDEVIGHHDGMTAFNGYPFEYIGGLSSNAGGPTIDQVIADAIGEVTPVRAVHVQISKRLSTDGDGGTTVIAMSHRGEPGSLTANVPQTNPQDVWQTLFGNFMPPIDDRAQRTKVLDAVRADVARLQKRLGQVDKQRLDAHLQGIDELEDKITALLPACDLPDVPTEDNVDTGGEEPISSVTEAMGQLIAYAFACDVTRVASFLFKKFVSSTVFDEINATNQHHSSSHNGPEDTNYRNGVVYQMERLSQVLQILAGTPDVTGGNLLDSTIVYATTDVSTGVSHAIQRQPIILAGGGRGYLVHPGIHYQATPWNGSHTNPNGTGNMSDVLLTCLQAFDPDATSVGGGTAQSQTALLDVVA